MAKNGDLCRICGEGNLSVQLEKNAVEYKGVKENLDSLYAVCDCCGSEQTDAEQARTNKRLMIAFKKRVDGLLIGSQVRALREKLGLNQAQAAKVFGGGPVAFSKYESDDVAQSEAMDNLLRSALEVPGVVEYLSRRAGLESVSQWSEATDWQVKVVAPVKRTRLTSVHTLSSAIAPATYVA